MMKADLSYRRLDECIIYIVPAFLFISDVSTKIKKLTENKYDRN
jgi:hypothetical protein